MADDYGFDQVGYDDAKFVDAESALSQFFRFDVPIADDQQLRDALRLIIYARRYSCFELVPHWWRRNADNSITLRVAGHTKGFDRRGDASTSRNVKPDMATLKHLFGTVQNLCALDPTLENREDIDAFELLDRPTPGIRGPFGNLDEHIVLLKRD